MSAPDPIIPEKVSLFGGVVVPPKYLAEKGDDGFAANPVGTGAFKFQSRQQDSQIVLTGNDAYWGGAPKVTNLTIKITPDPATAIAALQSGEIDIVTGLTPDAIDQIGSGSGASAQKVPGVREYYVAMNTLDGGPFANEQVRLALNYAVDVDTLIKTVLNGAAQRTPTLLPDPVFGFDSSVPAFNYDAAKAKSMLAAAGYPNGFSTQLSASTVDQDVAQAIAGQLAKVGVKCNVKIVDATQFKALLVSGDPKAMGPMYLSGNTGWTLDGESYFQSTIRSDRRQSLWHNPAADALVDKEEQSLSSTERTQAFADLQKLLVQHAPFIYLYNSSNVYAIRDGIDWKIPGNGVLAMASAKGK
jgi:peptide/nickel transport system substrate-binding protein